MRRLNAANDGSAFEDLIKSSGEFYDVLELGYIEKHEVRVIVRNGKAIYTEKKGFDFSGVVYGTREGVFFEAKDIKGELQIRRPGEKNPGAGVKPHQLGRLVRLEKRIGNNSFVLWRNEHGVFKISPLFLEREIGYGHSLSAIRAVEIAEKQQQRIIQIEMKQGILDYLQLL